MDDPETLRLHANGWMPNNPALPVLVYRGAIPVGDPAAAEALLERHGWRPDWRNGVYSFHHYHSTAHEALACTGGFAELMLGGEGGQPLTVSAGDLLVLPAGTGHCRRSASGDFLLGGAYPEGQHWDICRSAADDETLMRIATVPLPSADPIGGEAGPLTRLWGGGR